VGAHSERESAHIENDLERPGQSQAAPSPYPNGSCYWRPQSSHREVGNRAVQRKPWTGGVFGKHYGYHEVGG